MINTLFFSDNLKKYLEEEKYIDETLDDHQHSDENIDYINIAENIIKNNDFKEKEEEKKYIEEIKKIEDQKNIEETKKKILIDKLKRLKESKEIFDL